MAAVRMSMSCSWQGDMHGFGSDTSANVLVFIRQGQQLRLAGCHSRVEGSAQPWRATAGSQHLAKPALAVLP
jgi:hypothetical protein